MVCNRELYEVRCRLATQFSDRLQIWRVLGIATLALLLLPAGAMLLSLDEPALAARQTPSAPQQKSPSSRVKKTPGSIDPRSVLTQPNISRPQPPQPPHFQVSSTPPSVRVGEVVTFSLQLVKLLREFSRSLEIDFGDQTPRQQLETVGPNISHWYSAEGSYAVGVYLRGLRNAAFPSVLVSDPLTVQVGPWKLSPLPAPVEIGDQVSFAIDHPSTDQSIEYRFHFGDDSPASGWVSGSQATHRYHSVDTYKPFVEIRRVIDRPMNALARTTDLSITITALPEKALRLDLAPTPPVEIEKVVTFTATLESKFDKDDPQIKYRFVFGDGTPSEWQSKPVATHPYSSAGQYPAHVEVAWFNGQLRAQTIIATTEQHPINVTVIPRGVKDAWIGSSVRGTAKPSPPNGGPDWKLIIIPALAVIALAILFAGYQTMKGRFSVKPDYRAHRDIGIAQTTGGSLAIAFDIRLKPDVTEALYQLDVPEAGLIRYERRQHD